jgi:hypothetical protein
MNRIRGAKSRHVRTTRRAYEKLKKKLLFRIGFINSLHKSLILLDYFIYVFALHISFKILSEIYIVSFTYWSSLKMLLSIIFHFILSFSFNFSDPLGLFGLHKIYKISQIIIMLIYDIVNYGI